MNVCISNITFPTIGEFLEIIGLISLVLTAIRIVWVFFSSGIEWIDNVTIVEEPYQKDKNYEEPGEGIYPIIFHDKEHSNQDYLTVTMLSPQQTIIRNLKIKQFDDSSIHKRKWKYKTVEVVKQITPQFPLCVIVERGEAIAPYIIEWRIDYGGKASYYFYDNMRDGNNNRRGIEYQFGVLAKIRKLLDLK